MNSIFLLSEIIIHKFRIKITSLIFTYPHSQDCVPFFAAFSLVLSRNKGHSPGSSTSPISRLNLKVKRNVPEVQPVMQFSGEHTLPNGPLWQTVELKLNIDNLLTSKIGAPAITEVVPRRWPGSLSYFECVLLNLLLRLPRIIILKVNVTLPFSCVFLLETINNNTACVLNVALNRGLKTKGEERYDNTLRRSIKLNVYLIT